MTTHYYKTNAAAAVNALTDFAAKRAAWKRQTEILEDAIGEELVFMNSCGSLYVVGVYLRPADDNDVYWCRPSNGYRKLRAKPAVPKGAAPERRAAIVARHAELKAVWKENDPGILDVLSVWDALGVNSGNVLFGGGAFRMSCDAVYFHVGFPLDQDAEHKRATGKATAGWVEGAVEITATEFQTAWDAAPEL